jgi:hypothetical protein
MFNLFKTKNKPVSNNTMFTLQPYRYLDQWVFDDFTRGLVAEAFVCGMSEIIDEVLLESEIDPVDVQDGFRMTFSTTAFPDHTHSLSWERGDEESGNWYRCDQTNQSGWLCPALFLFFPKAPERLYARADKLN